MTDTLLQTVLLALIAFCTVVSSVSLLITVSFLLRASHRVDLLLENARRLFTWTDRAARFTQNLFGRFGRPHRVRPGYHRVPSHVTNKRRIA